MTTPTSSPLKEAMKGFSSLLAAGGRSGNFLTKGTNAAGTSGTTDRVTRLGSGALVRSSEFERPRDFQASTTNKVVREGSELSAEDRSGNKREDGAPDEDTFLQFTAEEKQTLTETMKEDSNATIVQAMIKEGRRMQEQIAAQNKQIEMLLARPVPAGKKAIGKVWSDRRKSGAGQKGAAIKVKANKEADAAPIEEARGKVGEGARVEIEEDAASINSTRMDSDFAAVERAMATKSAEDRRAAGGKPPSPSEPSLFSGYLKVDPAVSDGPSDRSPTSTAQIQSLHRSQSPHQSQSNADQSLLRKISENPFGGSELLHPFASEGEGGKTIRMMIEDRRSAELPSVRDMLAEAQSAGGSMIFSVSGIMFVRRLPSAAATSASKQAKVKSMQADPIKFRELEQYNEDKSIVMLRVMKAVNQLRGFPVTVFGLTEWLACEVEALLCDSLWQAKPFALEPENKKKLADVLNGVVERVRQLARIFGVSSERKDTSIATNKISVTASIIVYTLSALSQAIARGDMRPLNDRFIERFNEVYKPEFEPALASKEARAELLCDSMHLLGFSCGMCGSFGACAMFCMSVGCCHMDGHSLDGPGEKKKSGVSKEESDHTDPKLMAMIAKYTAEFEVWAKTQPGVGEKSKAAFTAFKRLTPGAGNWTFPTVKSVVAPRKATTGYNRASNPFEYFVDMQQRIPLRESLETTVRSGGSRCC